MGVAIPHCICAGGFVVLTGRKTIHDARRHTSRSQHDGHRRRKILAMARFHVEEKISERIGATRFHFHRITNLILKIRFDRFRGVVTIARV